MNAALAAYQRNSVDTATRQQLVTMLYDGLLTALDRAEATLDSPRPDIELAHRELTRSQDIVMELMSSLNAGAGPIATSLASLYEYCHRQLVEANVMKDFGPAQPVRSIFVDLRGAWVAITESAIPEVTPA